MGAFLHHAGLPAIRSPPVPGPTIARLGIRALAAGSPANLMSGALAGLFIGL
ncbi:MAG: hypothetical protein LBV50_03435 [Novosphingobium sp.]|jgi:nucleoside permease NupC|nr:hypothetical protein [Novosphingobium sp.]